MASLKGDLQTVAMILKESQHWDKKEKYVPEKREHILKEKEEFVILKN